MNPVLNIPAILKFSCFGKLPNGVATKTDDIKFKESPTLRFRLNASSEPINILFVLKLFKFPFEIKLLKNSIVFFSFLSTPFKITPLALFLLIIIPSPEYALLKFIFLNFFYNFEINSSEISKLFG